MRVNIYAEEMTGKVELITKTVEGEEFVAVRFWLYLPVTQGAKSFLEANEWKTEHEVRQIQGPFMLRPGDDDSSAVTFWGKRELRNALAEALALLDAHYSEDKYAALIEQARKEAGADVDRIDFFDAAGTLLHSTQVGDKSE